MTEGLVGTRGTVTVAIPGPRGPGEVMVETAGGTRKIAAYASEEIPCYASVVVYDVRPGGVEVTPVG
jgi:ubiquinone/menaquinone biosynthesis C-methylase UbiE